MMVTLKHECIMAERNPGQSRMERLKDDMAKDPGNYCTQALHDRNSAAREMAWQREPHKDAIT